VSAVTAGSRRRRRPRGGELLLVRYLERASPVHRLWAGTKLVGSVAVGVALSMSARWTSVAVVAGFLLLVLRVARIPWAAMWRPPRWLIGLLAIGALSALAAGGDPTVDVGGHAVGFGGLDDWGRLLAVVVVLVVAAGVVTWTTPLADVAPAVARLAGPLRRLRVPVDDLAVAVALSVRSLPLLAEELRVLLAAHRLRPARHRPSRREQLRWPVDALATALVVSLRRAREMGDAIEARGGPGPVTAGAARAGRADAVALVLVAAVCAAAVVV
jgi:energy-coupling factor transporter transmembrane protein EcfT